MDITEKKLDEIEREMLGVWGEFVFLDTEGTRGLFSGRRNILVGPPRGRRALVQEYTVHPIRPDLQSGRYTLTFGRSSVPLQLQHVHTKAGLHWRAAVDEAIVAAYESPLILAISDWPLEEEDLPQLTVTARFV